MKKWNFINKLLQPMCKAIDRDIAFLLPVPAEKTCDIVKVNIGCDSLLGIAKDVLNAMQ